MTVAPATLVLFAIQSAVKLGRQAQAAYIDNTQRRALVLPLPNFDPRQDQPSAVAYFLDRRGEITGPETLRRLIGKLEGFLADNAPVDLSDEESRVLIAFHNQHLLRDLQSRGIAAAEAGELTPFSDEALDALVTIRQWQRGSDPNPSVLQRLAGSFLEISVDYFASVPGSLDRESSRGRALHALFTSLDAISFAEEPLGDLPAKLLVATLESTSGAAGLISGDPKVQDLISVTSTALVRDVAARLKVIRAEGLGNLDKEERVARWAELVFRSVLGSAGGLVSEDPQRFLGIQGAGETALVGEVSQAVLGLVLDTPEGQLDAVFSRESLDRVVKAALGTLSRHPELLAEGHPGLKALVQEISAQLLALDSLVEPGVLPEVARIVIERSAINLPLLWPDALNRPERHLLLIVARQTLLVLSRAPQPGDTWSPSFGRADLLFVLDGVLAEMAENPGWIVTAAGELDTDLAEIVAVMLEVLRQRADDRLSLATGREILLVAVRAVAARAEFLEDSPGGLPLAAAVIAAVMTTAFALAAPRRVSWVLLRHDTLVGLVELSLAQMQRISMTPAAVTVLEATLTEQAGDIAAGKPWDLAAFEAALGEALEAQLAAG